MAISKKTVGTGITAKTNTSYSGDDMAGGLKESFEAWGADFDEGGGQFGAVALRWRKTAEAVRKEFSEEYPARDSMGWFAQQVMTHHRIVEKAIREGDIQTAARFGFDLGILVAEWRMKCGWEDHALLGVKTRKNPECKSRCNIGPQKRSDFLIVAE